MVAKAPRSLESRRNLQASERPYLLHSDTTMPPSDFANADIESIIEQLTLDEQVALITGVGLWYTHAIPRLNIPAIKVRRISVQHEDINRLLIGQRWAQWYEVNIVAPSYSISYGS